MEPQTIKASAATVTYDGNEITIKHLGYRVTATIGQIIGVELQEPGRVRLGKFQLKTTGGISKGFAPPKEPWTVSFPDKSAAAFRALYDDLNGKINH